MTSSSTPLARSHGTVIVVDDVEAMREARELGALACFDKPFDLEELGELVSQVVHAPLGLEARPV
jgi:hypothetical protein